MPFIFRSIVGVFFAVRRVMRDSNHRIGGYNIATSAGAAQLQQLVRRTACNPTRDCQFCTLPCFMGWQMNRKRAWIVKK